MDMGCLDTINLFLLESASDLHVLQTLLNATKLTTSNRIITKRITSRLRSDESVSDLHDLT